MKSITVAGFAAMVGALDKVRPLTPKLWPLLVQDVMMESLIQATLKPGLASGMPGRLVGDLDRWSIIYGLDEATGGLFGRRLCDRCGF